LSYDLESTLVCLTGQEVRNLHVSKEGCDCSLNLVSLSSLRAAMELSSLQRMNQMMAILIQRLHSFFPDKQRKSSTTKVTVKCVFGKMFQEKAHHVGHILSHVLLSFAAVDNIGPVMPLLLI